MSLRVLRLCSVFEPVDGQCTRPEFDPIGGMQNHTAALTDALDREGVEQLVITSRLGGPTGRTPRGRHGEVVRVGLPLRRFRQAWAPAALALALRSRPADVVHVHQGEDLAVLPVGAAVARRWGVPLVVTLHCSLRHSVPRAGLRLTALRVVGGAVEERTLRRADAVITLTDRTAGLVKGPFRTVVIPSGVDTVLFRDAVPDAAIAAVPGPRVLYLGRLAQQKDVATLVRAFGLVRTPASLVVVGDGPDRPAVDAAVAALPEDVRVRVHRSGFRPHGDVPNVLAAADVLALPSVYEEMGSVLAEAMHAAVPVVASDVGGVPDVVVDGRTGLLVPPRDPVRLAAALDELLASPGRRAAMQQACRERSARYSWEHLAGQVLEVYEDVRTARSSSAASADATRSMS